MRIGKVKESVLNRSVLRQLHTKTENGSPMAGEDAGLVSFSEELAGETIAVTTNPVEGWTLAPKRAVYGAVNSLLAAKAVPQVISLSVLMPEETEEAKLKKLMGEMDACCGQEGIQIVSGHTAVSPYVTTLLLSVTAIGTRERQRGQKETFLLKPDLDVVVVGNIAGEGTAMLAMEREKELLTRYSSSYIETAKRMFEEGSLLRAAKIFQEEEIAGIHDLREGGVFAGLWEMASAGKVGLSIELRKIPIRQHTIEVCEFFNLNPYMLRSGGSLLLACAKGERVANRLLQEKIPAVVVGRTTKSKERLIHYDEEVRYLEPPKMDEYYKIRNRIKE